MVSTRVGMRVSVAPCAMPPGLCRRGYAACALTPRWPPPCALHAWDRAVFALAALILGWVCWQCCYHVTFDKATPVSPFTSPGPIHKRRAHSQASGPCLLSEALHPYSTRLDSTRLDSTRLDLRPSSLLQTGWTRFDSTRLDLRPSSLLQTGWKSPTTRSKPGPSSFPGGPGARGRGFPLPAELSSQGSSLEGSCGSQAVPQTPHASEAVPQTPHVALNHRGSVGLANLDSACCGCCGGRRFALFMDYLSVTLPLLHLAHSTIQPRPPLTTHSKLAAPTTLSTLAAVAALSTRSPLSPTTHHAPPTTHHSPLITPHSASPPPRSSPPSPP